MKHILMSLDAEWAEAILNGEKHWEYRKIPPGIPTPYKWIIYANQPVGKVVGDVIIDDAIRDNKANVLSMTIHETPHSKQEIREYFGNRREYCALHIDQDSLNRYDEPFSLDKHPPQNYEYVEPGEITP